MVKIKARRAGPLPKPSNEAAKAGANGRTQRAAVTERRIKHEAAGTEAPAWLGDVAADKWRELATALSDQGLLESVDRDSLANYCDLWQTYRHCSEEVNKAGVTTESANGNTFVHPAARLRTSVAEQMRKLALEFGMTPAARSRVVIDEQGDEDQTVKAILGD